MRVSIGGVACRRKLQLLVATVVVMAAGCAAQLPDSLRASAAQEVDVSTLQRDPDEHAGRSLRLGGVIDSVRNEAQHTWVEIVARPLSGGGRPKLSENSSGRFLARFDGFLDPAVYEPGREITVVGTLDGPQSGRIGDYEYVYPVVSASAHVLWRPLPPPDPYPWPHFYDPHFHDPWDCHFPHSRWRHCF